MLYNVIKVLKMKNPAKIETVKICKDNETIDYKITTKNGTIFYLTVGDNGWLSVECRNNEGTKTEATLFSEVGFTAYQNRKWKRLNYIVTNTEGKIRKDLFEGEFY